MLGLDTFPSAFYFQLPNGRQALPSKLGTFFTLILAMLLGVYGFFELANLVQNDNAGIFSYTVLSNFDSDYEFDMDKGGSSLQIAFGLTGYDDNYSMIDEP